MIIKKLLCTIAVYAGILACTGSVSAAAAVSVTIPEFDIIVNGRYVENDYRQYPFIVYNDITYFPMTCSDCKFLGLSNSWSFEEGTSIQLTGISSGVYDDTITPYFNNVSGEAAYITEGAIAVNGTYIDNVAQQYPVLTFRDVPYFPLTWEKAQTFGWSLDFSATDGLYIASSGYANDGSVKYYSSYNSPYNGQERNATIYDIDGYNIRGTSSDKSGSVSYSPNHFRSDTYSPDNEYTEMYSLGEISTLWVKNSSVDSYRTIGWYTLEELEKMYTDRFSSNTLFELELITEEHFKKNIYSHDPAYTAVDTTIEYLRQNYISVFPYDLSAKTVISKQLLQSCKEVGWLTYDDFIINAASSLALSGQTAKALAMMDLGRTGNIFSVDHSYTLPHEYHDTSYDAYYSTVTRGYADTLLKKGNAPLVVVDKSIETNKYGKKELHLGVCNISYKDVRSVTISVTCYDSSGSPTSDYSYYNGTITFSGDIEIDSCGFDILTGSLSGNSKTAYVGNIKVMSITFTDGTTWKR